MMKKVLIVVLVLLLVIGIVPIGAFAQEANLTVTYDAAGRFSDPADEKQYTSGEKATVLDGDHAAHDQSGKHNFIGWTTNKNVRIVSNKNQYDKLVASDTFYTAGKQITVNKNITLYAVFGSPEQEEVFEDVFFVAGEGGSFAEGTKTEFIDIPSGTAFKDAVTVPTPVPSKGYYFSGWDSKFPDEVTETKTFTAQFKKQIPVTLTSNSKTVVYNGQEQEVTGFTGAPTGIMVTGLTARGYGKNVQDPRPGYTVIFKGTPTFTDSNGTDVTDQYAITYKTGKLWIMRAPLTITAEDTQKKYGEKNPPFTYEANFQGEDKETAFNDYFAKAVGLSYTCEANETSPVGSTHDIVPSGSAQSINYNITYQKGTLSVVKSDELTVSADAYAGIYDAGDHDGVSNVQANVTDGTSITYSTDGAHYQQEIPEFKEVGAYKAYVKAENDNYEDSVQTFDVIIDRAPLTITADDKSKVEGEFDPMLSAKIKGLQGTDQIHVALSRESGETVGTYEISVEPEEDANYEITATDGTFTITAAVLSPPIPPVNPTPISPVTPAVPIVPAASAAPVTPIAPAAETVLGAAEAEPAVTIPDNQTPLAGGEEGAQGDTKQIDENKTPLASGNMGSEWALLNLLLAVATGLITLSLFVGYFFGKKEKDENGRRAFKRKGILRLISIIPAVIAVIAFVLTENMADPMVFTDKWTVLMAVIAVVQVIVMLFAKKNRKEEDQPQLQQN